MSATLDAELFGQYFGGCPTMHAEGRTFPVQQVSHEQRWKSSANRGISGWEIAHEAVSRRPPISLSRIVARTHRYTCDARV
jgi:HrpA-like RNA helicase